MADVNMNANFDNYTSFNAKFGVVINSVVVDPEVTEDSSNPVASSGIFTFVEREVGIEAEAREKSIAQEAQTRMEREESLYNNFSARLKNEREAREESDNTIYQTIEGLSSSVVKTVNHIGPDADGNVNIEGGSGNVDDVLVDGTSVLGDDKIARIPRASTTDSGTIKIGNGAQLTSAGTIRATALTKPNYDAANGNTFVGKTTLENVLNPIREEINTVEDRFNNHIAPQIFCVNFGASGGAVVYYDGKDIVLKANGGWTNITYGIFFKAGTYRVSLDSIDGAVGNLEISNYRFGEMPTTGKVIVDKDNLSVDFTYDHDAWGAFSITNAYNVAGNIEFKNAKIVKIA